MRILNVIIRPFVIVVVKQAFINILEEVQGYATNWLWHYNHDRLHQANKGKPPLMAA